MKVSLCRDYHGPLVAAQIDAAWNGEHCLLLVPPTVTDGPELERMVQAVPRFPEPPLFGLCTSGTLGKKLILYSRKNILASLDGILSFFDVDAIDAVFSYPQPFHVFGLVLGYLFPLIYQKDLLVPSGPYSRAAHAEWLERVGEGTLTLGTPTHFQDLLAYCHRQEITPRPSYSAIIGGAPVSRALWLQLQEELKIAYPSIGYGASELSPGATHLPPGWVPREDYEIGLPLPNVALEIYPGRGIQVRGENACLAIFQNGRVSFPEEIWLRDEVKSREDGVLVFSNRTDLLLNRGGEKYSFEEIERLLWCELRLETVAVGVSDDRLGEELALVVKGEGNRSATYDALKNTFGRDFNSSLYYPIVEFPRGESAKIDRLACRRYVEAQRAQH